MGLTFRGEKGSPLLHTELDNNFREFFYSASVSGSDLLMFRSRSLDNTVTLPLSYPKGGEYAIQLKKGTAPSGSGTSFSGSQNLIYDFRENTTKISGSLIISSSRVTTPFLVQGSGSITGDLVVGGKVTAEEFITEYSTVAVSTIYKSGSSKFGDTLDDTHTFIGGATITGSLTVSGSTTLKNIGLLEQTGSVKILGSTVQTGSQNTLGDISIEGAVSINGATSITGSQSLIGEADHVGNIIRTGSFSQLGALSLSGNVDITGSTTQLGNQTITGDVTQSGDILQTSNIIQTGNTIRSGNTQLIGDVSHTGSYFISGNITQIGNYTQTGNLDLTGFDINSSEITASNNISIGLFDSASDGEGPFLLLAGNRRSENSSHIYFADTPNQARPNHGGIGITYDAKNNKLRFVAHDVDAGDKDVFILDRDGNVTISGSLTQISDDDTVFSGSLVVTETVSGSNAVITNGVQAGSLTGSIDASNLENVPYAVTASNTFYGDQNVVGDVTASNLNVSGNTLIEGNLTVNGTGSFSVIQSVTGSAKIIGDAFIQLNENTPSERYAGIQVVDSGSAFSTASFFFDGLENNWMYEYDGDDTEYALALFGPEFGTKGSPVSLTQNIIPKATGSHHLVDSNISDDGSTISLGSNVAITGTLTATDDITAFYSSDERLKDNIVRISNPIDKVKQIKGVEFDWNGKQDVYKGHDVGVIAQDIEKVLPELVITRDSGFKAVKYEKIIALLIEAVKDQQSQIDELKSKL